MAGDDSRQGRGGNLPSHSLVAGVPNQALVDHLRRCGYIVVFETGRKGETRKK